MRALAPTLDRDRYMSDELELVADAVERGEFLRAVTAAGITLR